MLDQTGPATQSPMEYPSLLAVLPQGDLFILEQPSQNYGGFGERFVSANGKWSYTPSGAYAGPSLVDGVTTANGKVYLIQGESSESKYDGATGIYQLQADGSMVLVLPLPENSDLFYALGLATDGAGNYYILGGNKTDIQLEVWKASRDGGLQKFYSPPVVQVPEFSISDICLDAAGNVYVAENTRVFKVTPAGVATTLAGTGVAGFSGDFGPATSAQLNGATGVAVDAAGNVYIADSYNRRVRMIGPDGTIRTIHVTPSYEPAGPDKLYLDAAANVYLLEKSNALVRELSPNPAASITVLSGDSQSAPVGSTLPNPLVVQVTGKAGAPAEALSVAWKVTSGGATLAAATSFTDATGTATMTASLGSIPGTVTVTATAGSLPPVVFTAAAAAPASAVTVASGNGQTGGTGRALANPLAVQVVASDGSRASGITVAFTVASGAATLSANSVVTGSDGVAKVTVTLGPTAGPVVVSATVGQPPVRSVPGDRGGVAIDQSGRRGQCGQRPERGRARFAGDYLWREFDQPGHGLR